MSTGAGRSPRGRLGGRASPASTRPSSVDDGSGESCATGRPRSVTTMTSPPAARATTADAFCLSARMPTSSMCFIVEHRPCRRYRAGRLLDQPHKASQCSTCALFLGASRLAAVGDIINEPSLLLGGQHLERVHEGPTTSVRRSTSDLETGPVIHWPHRDVRVGPHDLPRRLAADQFDGWCFHVKDGTTGVSQGFRLTDDWQARPFRRVASAP